MKNLAIFYGGKSAEHDISIITALQVLRNINKEKYNVIPIYITENNEWYNLKEYENINNYAQKKYIGFKCVTGFINKFLVKKTKFGLKKYTQIDCCINCCHGLNGEDGTLAGLLELSNIPYVGSNVLASSVGMDKVIMKDVFIANKIPCTQYLNFSNLEYKNNKDNIILEAEVKLSYPIVVKPANLGSSIGINIAKNREELIESIEIASNFDKKIILEKFVNNLREINCSVIGNYKECEVSILEEPKNWKYFLDFNEKYLNEDIANNKTIDVTLGEEIDDKIKVLSKQVFKLLGCCGCARIDFLFDDKTKELFVNEINTVPGSYANYLWQHKYSFQQLLDKLLEYSVDEYLYKNSYKYAYNSNVLKNFTLGQKNSKQFQNIK